MNVPRPNDVMQVKTVKGQVLDSEGSPLAGVSIKVEGTRQGVVSDVNGNFVLNLPGGQDANLVFSFIGNKTFDPFNVFFCNLSNIPCPKFPVAFAAHLGHHLGIKDILQLFEL